MYEETTMNVVFIKIKQFLTSSRVKDGIQPQSMCIKQEIVHIECKIVLIVSFNFPAQFPPTWIQH